MLALWLAAGLLAGDSGETPPPPTQTARGGATAWYSPLRLRQEREWEERRAERERVLADAIASAYRKATGEEREEIAEAVDLPEKPVREDFVKVAREISRPETRTVDLRDLQRLQSILVDLAALKYQARVQQIMADVIARAIEEDEADIEELLLS